MMTFQVTDIDFDIDCSYDEMTIEDRQELFDEVVGSYWEAIDEDDLIEEITAATGWCIKSIDYRIILTRELNAEYTLEPQDLN
jgi:hypothetical protein